MASRSIGKWTGRAVRIPGLNICGKSASIQSTEKKAHAAFIAFAPAENPEISVIVFIEQGEKGGAVAGPLVRTIIQKWAGKYYYKKNKVPAEKARPENVPVPSLPLDTD